MSHRDVLVWFGLLTVFLILDTVLSIRVLTDKPQYAFEGNPVAAYLGIKGLLVLKLAAATALLIWTLRYRRPFMMKASTWIMAGLVIWNVLSMAFNTIGEVMYG